MAAERKKRAPSFLAREEERGDSLVFFAKEYFLPSSSIALERLVLISSSFSFRRFGRVQSVKILNRHSSQHNGNGKFSSASSDGSSDGGSTSNGGASLGDAASVSFMDITSACKAHGVEHRVEDRLLRTDFYDPASGGHGSPDGGSSVVGKNVSAAVVSRLHG